MTGKDGLTRGQFLRFMGINLAAFVLPGRYLRFSQDHGIWPSYSLNLPGNLQSILKRVSDLEINPEGYLQFTRTPGKEPARLPLAQTQWNLERNNVFEKLFQDKPWGIVLHWFGDDETCDRSLAGYLRGFDGVRLVEDYATRTSAHFLVGPGDPSTLVTEPLGIIQTQAPYQDGSPLVASHIRPLDYRAYRQKQQYFVRALDEMSYSEPTIHTVLQDFYKGPVVDPNYQTIAIEITGHGFEQPRYFPSAQQVANVLSVVWAVMKRYGIEARNLLGHHEIELRKKDPSKEFIAFIRYLVGLKALSEEDSQIKQLVFGSFLGKENDPLLAIRRYFAFIRNFYVMVGFPNQIYAWEASSKYWFLYDSLSGQEATKNVADSFCLPIQGQIATKKDKFLRPENHEGVDLFLEDGSRAFGPPVYADVLLVADGECIYTGRSYSSCGQGKTAMFRHRPPDGAEIITVYSHLNELGDLNAGKRYVKGTRIGNIESAGPEGEGFLHFAIAYRATWDIDLKSRPYVPLGVNSSWIKYRYLPPLEYLDRYIASGDLLHKVRNE